MSKKTFYFPHDGNARNDEKMLALRMQHGGEGYGFYFMLIEKLLESTDYTLPTDYKVIAFDLHTNPELIKSIVEDFGLFEFDHKSFYSKTLKNRMTPLENTREQRREAGRKSAEKRALNKQKVTTVETEPNEPSTTVDPKSNRVEESKVKEKDTNVSKKKEDASSSHTPSDFEKFNEWIKQHAPYCANSRHFRHQLTENELLELKETYSTEQIADTILKIENRKDLRKRYTNLYRTASNWLKREQPNIENRTPYEQSAPKTDTTFAGINFIG